MSAEVEAEQEQPAPRGRPLLIATYVVLGCVGVLMATIEAFLVPQRLMGGVEGLSALLAVLGNLAVGLLEVPAGGREVGGRRARGRERRGGGDRGGGRGDAFEPFGVDVRDPVGDGGVAGDGTVALVDGEPGRVGDVAGPERVTGVVVGRGEAGDQVEKEPVGAEELGAVRALAGGERVEAEEGRLGGHGSYRGSSGSKALVVDPAETPGRAAMTSCFPSCVPAVIPQATGPPGR